MKTNPRNGPQEPTDHPSPGPWHPMGTDKAEPLMSTGNLETLPQSSGSRCDHPKLLSHSPSREEFDYDEIIERAGYDFGLSRRSFVKTIGAGLLITVSLPALAQNREFRGRGDFFGAGARTVGARIHLGTDGSITVLSGKVEAGQGARTELSQAAAEELRVPVGRIRMLLADTVAVPNDGMTAGSRTTPGTVPAVRQGAAVARELLIRFACDQWRTTPARAQMRDGKVIETGGNRSISYADLAKSSQAPRLFARAISPDVELTPVKDWTTLGKPASRPNARDIVTGAYKYPSDISRPGMLYGKILRPPAFGATLTAIDMAPARAMRGVVAVRDGEFAGVAAPNTLIAEKALAAIAKTAKWGAPPAQASSRDLFDYLRQNAEEGLENPFAGEFGGTKALRRTYDVPYIQHAPLEPRAAVAEWNGGHLSVWTGSQNPFGTRRELAQAFHLPDDAVRVVIPDFGAAFGGKHTAECAVEAARLAQGAGKPVSLRWTREEEFTWAYFRPAAVIDTEASLDARGRIATWHFININSGPNAVETPYEIEKTHCRFVRSKPPLRQGSYRALAATANNFAREVFMDELAAAARSDPLDFRLAHLNNARLRAVLTKAAAAFNWRKIAPPGDDTRGVGLACGTEKGSCVAACAEVEIDRGQKAIKVRRVCQAFECGAILNPENLRFQNQGAILMGMGAALREVIQFADGKVLNASFWQYRVPRFDDAPELDIQLVDRPDLPSAGAGETPIIAIAPAIANAVFRAIGQSVRALPIRLA
ncbi:MAG: molybdopterin cofactor-binding domain-containing protein [Limisphaerales bacterium]